MKKLAAAILGVLLGTTAVSAQDPARLYTQPALPPPDALDRLHLKMAWYTYLPTDGRRDRIYTVQIADYAQGQQILVQTRSGGILALDSSTGASQWRVRPGLPYVVSQPLGYNSNTVFVIYGASLFALARDTGQLLWEFSLPHTPASGPVADEERVYITLGTGRVQAYLLPKLGANAPETLPGPGAEKKPEPPPEAPKPPTRSDYKQQLTALGVSGRSLQSISAVSSAGQSVRSIGPLGSGQMLVAGLQPLLLWEYESDTRLEVAPLLTTNFVFLVSGRGTFNAVAKTDSRLLYRFPSEMALSAPLGQYTETAYVSSTDYALHAFDIFAGRVQWRFLGGGPILRTPAVTDEDLYVNPERDGLYRLDRGTGQADWHNTNAEHFVAANKKLVYATDSSGRLLILDRARGRQLGVYAGTRDFVVPISNELTDRLYLASNDGLLLCLHDRDYPTPLRMRTVEEPKAAPAPAGANKPPPDKGDVKRPDKPADKADVKKPDDLKAKGDEKKPEK